MFKYSYVLLECMSCQNCKEIWIFHWLINIIYAIVCTFIHKMRVLQLNRHPSTTNVIFRAYIFTIMTIMYNVSE